MEIPESAASSDAMALASDRSTSSDAMALARDDASDMNIADEDAAGCAESGGELAPALPHLGAERLFRTQPQRTCELPRFGCAGADGVVQRRMEPPLHRVEPLSIKLRQATDAEELAARRRQRHSPIVPAGEEPTITLYCTPRVFGATQVTLPFLTRRNKRELPASLRFDPLCAATLSSDLGECVSPVFVEWLMGLPRGWTSTAPLRTCGSAGMPGIFAGVPWPNAAAPKYRSLSLFTGSGALDWGLQNFIEPVAYCESDSFALSLLEARVAEGTLPQGPIWRDVHTLTRREWPAHLAAPNGIVAGWPCQDLSKAGKRRGMSAPRSGLWREVMRIADEFRSDFLLLESVDQLRFCFESWRPLLDAFAERSFNVRWVSLAAQNAGSPQDRRRIFIFATREGHEVQGFLACSSAQSVSGPGTGLLFNSGRPHPRDWLLPRAEHKLVRARLCALANGVVPQQAALAFRLLLSLNAE